MKVEIITRHAISNYGSLLQSLALQNTIESLGHQAEIIDYIRDDEDYHNITKTLVKKSVFWSRNKITRMLYCIILRPLNMLTSSRFRGMQKEYLNLSAKLYKSINQLREDCPKADIYCTGSDQVWGAIGTEEYDSTYFLDFLSKPYGKCITYAASFGKTNISVENLKRYKELLKKYQTLLVRETSAVELVNSMGYSNCKQVIDPTLLISAEKWSEILQLNKKEDKYILIYQLHKSKEMDCYAKKVAKKYNMRLIRVSPSLHHIFRGGRFEYLPNLKNFVNFIQNASFMITDSFHGTAFAINFNVQFVDFYPGETSTRNISLLKLFELEDRVVSDSSNLDQILDKIDFVRVNKMLQSERNRSLELLNNALTQI